MATGGTFTTMDKIRPGAYLNIDVEPANSTVTGVRGVVAAAIPMTWGAEDRIIEVRADDFVVGRAVADVGVRASSEEALPLRLLLRGAQTALIYRLDKGGTKAQTIYTIPAENPDDPAVPVYTLTAKYAGTTGNNIIVSIQERVSRPGDYEVSTFLNGVRVDNQIVRSIEELTDFENDYVTITIEDGVSSIYESSGITLGDTTPGTNGTIDTSDLSNFFISLEYKSFNTVCVYSETPDFNDVLVDQVKTWTDGGGKRVQCVVLSETNTWDYEGVIIVNDGYTVENQDYEVTPGLFVLLIAGLRAGMPFTQELTSYEITEADEIITPKTNSQIINAIEDGILVLSYRQDGAVVIEEDINSKVTYNNPNEKALSRNQVVSLVYYVCNTVALLFNTSYSGKILNNEIGRATFKADVNSFLLELENDGVLQDVIAADDIRISRGPELTDVYIEIDLYVVGVMTKLYGIVTVFLNVRV